MKATEEQILQRIAEGKTVSEIVNEFGYKTDNSIYRIAHKHGIKITVRTETRICGICGKEFTPNAHNQKYCRIECQRKANRTPKGELDESKAIEYVSRHDGWEYVGGYTGCDGQMYIKHNECGTVYLKSCITVRSSPKLECKCCEDLKREEAKKQKRVQAEIRRLHSPVKKFKQIETKECTVCGAFFVGRSSKYCSDECARKVANRYSSEKKEIKRKRARTAHSNEITVQSLYRRDNGICWICGGKCDITADGNDNNYPSVDHIIPVSLGGKDEWDNVRLAHRICNSLRGNSPVETFPRLAGFE